MLVRFSVENYLSFKGRCILTLEPESLKERTDFLHTPFLYDVDTKVLKSVGIYGHNSHGKSNLLKAYDFFLKTLLPSSGQFDDDEIGIEPFRLNDYSYLDPTMFETTFYLAESKYRYGYRVIANKVVEEWLYYSQAKVRENYLFHRVEQEFKLSKNWAKESGKIVEKAIHFTQPGQLFLKTLFRSKDIPKNIAQIYNWIRGNIILQDLADEKYLKQALIILSTEAYRPLINRLIEKADLGFTSVINKIDSLIDRKVSLEEDILRVWFKNEIRDFTLHSTRNVYNQAYKLVETIQFEILKNESSGTIKFLILACYLSYAIKEGQLIIIDEIDSKFHVLLLKLILEFYNDSNINVMGSQMIFTTHNTFLLNDFLRRDQIYFVEKNIYGESSLRRAHTTEKPIRIDSSIEREYRKGKLGGVSKKLSDRNQTKLDF
jgi:uncharacterized protein